MGKPARWIKKLLGIKRSEKSKDKAGGAPRKGDPIDHVLPKKSEKTKHVVITPPAPLPTHVYEQIRKLDQQNAPASSPPVPSPLPPPPAAIPVTNKDQKVAEIPVTDAVSQPEVAAQPEVVAASEAGSDTFDDIEGAVVSREDVAAVKIQKAFKSYLARRALRALKGVIRLQALARGHAVRRQAAATLRCIQAIVRVQAVFRGRQIRVSEEGLAVHYLLQRYRQQADSWHSVQQEPCNEIYRHRGSRKVPADSDAGLAFQRQLQHSTPRRNPMFVDSALQSDSGWVWLQRWTLAQPWAIPNVVDASDTSPRLNEPTRTRTPTSAMEDPYEEFGYQNENGALEHEDGTTTTTTTTGTTSRSSTTEPGTRSGTLQPGYRASSTEPGGSTIEPATKVQEHQTPASPFTHDYDDDDFPVVENSFELSEPLKDQPAPAASDDTNGHHHEHDDHDHDHDHDRDHEEDDDDYEEEEDSSKFDGNVVDHSTASVNNNNSVSQRSTRSVPSYMAATQSAKAKVRSQSPKSASPTVKRRFSIPGPNSKVEPRRLSLPGGASPYAQSVEASPRRLSVSGAISNGRLADGTPSSARSPRLANMPLRNGKASSGDPKLAAGSEVRRSSEMRRSFKY